MSVESEEYSPLTKPMTAGSLTLRKWIGRHLYYLFLGDHRNIERAAHPHLADPTTENTSNRSFFSPIFMMTFNVDGYNVATHEIIPAYDSRNGEPQEKYEYKGEALPAGLLLAAYIGLPSRPDYCVAPDPDQANSDQTNEALINQHVEGQDPDQANAQKSLQFSGWRLLKNLVGGWDSLPDEPEYQEKIWTQRAVIPFKFIIFLEKFGSLFFKFPINIFKTFLELIPALATESIHLTIVKIIHDTAVKKQSSDGISPSRYWGSLVVIALLGLVHAAFRIITLTNRAIFSPEKAANLGWGSGDEVNKGLAIFLFYLNKTITSIVWAIALPLALGTLIFYFPGLIIPIITGIGNIPVVAASLTAMNGALVSLCTWLAMDFASVVSALSLLLHIEVSMASLVIGATIGFFAAPIAIILQHKSDNYSDRWAHWTKGGPVTDFLTWWNKATTPQNQPSSTSSTTADNGIELDKTSPSARRRGEGVNQDLTDAHKHLQNADAIGNSLVVGTPPSTSSAPTQPEEAYNPFDSNDSGSEPEDESSKVFG